MTEQQYISFRMKKLKTKELFLKINEENAID